MTTEKLTELEMEPLRIASLPTRPTSPAAFGGRGYTSTEMKAAFDKLPTLIAERLNSLIDDVTDGGICSSIPTGITSLATLKAVFDGIKNGDLASEMTVSGESLVAVLTSLREDVNAIAKRLGMNI